MHQPPNFPPRKVEWDAVSKRWVWIAETIENERKFSMRPGAGFAESGRKIGEPICKQPAFSRNIETYLL